MLTASGQNLLLSGGLGNTISYIGLANESGTELTGGSPAYARIAVTWAAAGSGQRATSADLTFDVAASSQVARVLLRAVSSGGTDYGYGWVGGFAPAVASVSQTTDSFTAPAHGMSNGDRVGIHPDAAASLPGGLTNGTLYYVINSSTSTFQVSLTSGGAAVNISSDGGCIFQKCVPESFTAQGTYKIASGSLILDGRFV